ncbi:ATP phosphoribosyltransferase regulatory subunit [Enterococcus faecium]|uniref:ATP phosphoribosyltransferase regulatory subunit n=1 Tax=Enterococcus faecium TaxID=1352 RepID=UPI000CF14743|nr:ATP phosphoribosyltransferase regulatory subunit [Enterococcus faecium]PQC90536.1 hypothetical protein CUN38_12595 [Enterococcus faecium]
MKSLKTRINQFYDLLDEELSDISYIQSMFEKTFINKGFFKMETSSIEEKKRYLNSTKVHCSKIFEVRRPKEKSIFLLQSDLALSMSRFIADNCDSKQILKLIQTGDIFRDRVDNLPGYRRKFKQILIGCWGSDNLYYDIELVSNTINTLKELYPKNSFYFQVSNHMILNCYFENCAEVVRFNGIESIQEKVTSEEFEVLNKLFSKPKFTLSEFADLLEESINCRHFFELKKVYDFFYLLKKEIHLPMYFSLQNLDGTNHYSGMTYRIYTKLQKKSVLIVDGGRIDHMVEKFNKSKKVPAVCLGVGIQVLCQFLILEYKRQEKTIIFCDENDYKQIQLAKKIQELINDEIVNIILTSHNKLSKYYKSPFYQNTKFIILNENEKEKVIFKNFNYKNLDYYTKNDIFIGKKIQTIDCKYS